MDWLTLAIWLGGCAFAVLLVVLVSQACLARMMLQDVERRLEMERGSRVMAAERAQTGADGGVVRSYTVRTDPVAYERHSSAGSMPSPRDAVPLVCSGGELGSVVGSYGSSNVSWLALSPTNDAARLWGDVSLGGVSYLVISGTLVRVWAAEGSDPSRPVLLLARAGSASPVDGGQPAGCSRVATLSPLPLLDPTEASTSKWNSVVSMCGAASASDLIVWGFSRGNM
jgi:hypothetical protein